MAVDSTAAQIATALGETEAQPRKTIERIVRQCGANQALAWLHETQQIEAAGGMMLPDNSRRRTPGGVFFHLVKSRLSKRERAAIFHPAQRGQRHPAPPALPAATWDERGDVIAAATAGKATTVKVTLIGRPGKTVERQGFTLALLQYSGPLPALPKGIPAPSKVPTTSYVIYIGAKQWRKVAEALASDPEDVLIVEGTQIYDAQYGAIAVFATNTTTRALQRAMRQGEG